MSAVFLKVLNMSITASWLILAVVLTRLILKKAPKWISCLLWGLVAIRLICPFSFESVLSLIPSSETVNTAHFTARPYIQSGVAIIDNAANDYLGDHYFEGVTVAPGSSPFNPINVISIIWIIGIAGMLLYALISYIRLKKSIGASVPVRDNILACDEIRAPFILGVFRPVIYVPSSISGKTLAHVIRHEKAHLQRHDHWWKPLGFLLLSVYWFHPLCWIAYILLCRDIETACDEKVIRDMDKEDIAAYSQALLDCSFPRKRIAACPLAFGEVGVKDRVKGVLNYKKPAFWIILIAIITCIVLAVCLMTDPFSNRSLSGKLGASVDMAVAEHHRASNTAGRFIATDYDVLLVSKAGSKTTVYAWVLYEEYSFDGRDVKVETGSHIPTAITFDTSASDKDFATYDVIEYWEPRDGSGYADDIRAKFPWSIRGRALDMTKSKAKSENCLQAAREYFEMIHTKEYSLSDGRYITSEATNETIVPYLLIHEGRFTVIKDNAVSYQPSGTIERNGNTVTMKSVYAGEMYIWVFDMLDNNQLKLRLGDSTIPVSSDKWKDGMVFTQVHDSEAGIDMDSLRAKYPEYFDLSTFKGLEVYVWQMGPDSYSCGVMLGTNRNKTPDELMDLKGATIAEMRAILSTYDIDEKDVSVIPWQNPVSSYLCEYWTGQNDEDEAAAEKRRQDYIDKIRQMLFGDTQIEEHDLQSPAAETKVSYASWTAGELIRDCLNGDKMLLSSVRHLPVYKFDSKEDLDRFKESCRDILTLDHGYDEVPSFNAITSLYDDGFFADHTVILAYVAATSGSFRYAIQDISYEGSAFCMDVVQTNDPETYTADMAGWFVIAEVLKSDVAACNYFDARLVGRE
ncbi:MAG: M56 family metallopeptidase [Clostridia bacterium]|nr:M56 family metallopeptidase [Clostridia bacterium]